MASDGFVYDAFISYSRRNLAAADQIERDLQKFALTRDIRNRLGRRHLNIFRDINDLTGNRLAPALEENLRQSRTLVVLCSPAARASIYVGMEIARFAELRDADHIVPVLVAGVPNNDPGTDPADWAFPDALNDALGGLPLAPDLRQDGAIKRPKGRLTEGSPWTQLVAGIVGVRPDDLTERIAKAERRRLLTLSGVLAVILAVVSTMAVFAWIQRNHAVEESLIATTRQVAATAQTRAHTDLQSALLLADTAYQTRAEPQTIQALHAVLTETPQLVAFYDFGAPVSVVDGTPDARTLVGGTESGTVLRLDRSTGTMAEVMALNAPIEFLSVSDDGKTIAATGTRYENSTAESSQSAVWVDGSSMPLPGKRIAAMSPSGRTVAVWSDDDTVQILANGQQTSLVHAGRAAWVELPDDTVVVAMSGDGYFTRAAVDGSTSETTQIPMGMSRVGGAVSPNGDRFTYISQGLENDIWDLSGPLPAQAGDAALTGHTGNARDSDITLSHNGTRMATAAEGSIFIGDVQSKGEPSAGYTELRGAGPRPHSLRFLSDDVILSASGSSAAIWDLRKTTPLATSVPAKVPSDCGACGPPRVIVSPDAGKAVIANNALPGTTLVDLATGASRSVTFGGKDPDPPPAMVWLDPHRVFAYAASGDAWILTGDRLDTTEREFSLPVVSNVTHTALRDDGTVVLVTERGLVLVDPAKGQTVQTGLNAVAVTTDGAYAVNLVADSGQNSTTVEIIDVASRQTVKTRVDGSLLNFVEHTDGNLALLRDVDGKGAGMESANNEVLLLSPGDGKIRSVIPLGDRAGATSSSVVSSADALFGDEAVEIGMYSLRDDLQLSLIPVESGHRSINALGLNRDGTMLVVADEAGQTVLRVPVKADAWSGLACEMAGRTMKPGELENVVDSAAGLVPGCRRQP